MLGGGDGVAAGRVHHDDAVLGGGVDVHVVDPYTSTTDDLQILSGLKNLGRDLSLAADNQSGELGDNLDQFGLREAGFDDNFEGAAGGKFINAALRKQGRLRGLSEQETFLVWSFVGVGPLGGEPSAVESEGALNKPPDKFQFIKYARLPIFCAPKTLACAGRSTMVPEGEVVLSHSKSGGHRGAHSCHLSAPGGILRSDSLLRKRLGRSDQDGVVHPAALFVCRPP